MTSHLRHALTALVLTLALATALAAPVSANSKDELERRKSGIIGQLSGAQEAYDQSSSAYAEAAAVLRASQAQLDQAQANLDQVRGELVVARARDAEMQAQLVESEEALAEAEAQLTQGEADLAESESLVAGFAVENLQSGDPGLRAFGELLRGEHPNTFSERMSLNTSISDAQVATMQRLDAARVMLQLNRTKVQELRDQVKVAREEAAANLAQIEVLEASAAQQADEVGQLVAVNTENRDKADTILQSDAAEVAALEAERSRTEAMIQQIIAEEAAAAAEAERRRNSGGGGNAGGGGSGGGGGGAGGGNTSTSLAFPIASPRITSQYGMRRHPITGVYKLHDGTDFGAGCGTPILAAANGTVISQYFHSAYGNRVLVNHGTIRGQNVVTTYNHLSRFAVSPGARVSRGQVIGYVGTTGLSTGCHLHFMVLANGATTNPMNWL